jgi:hypothetical protein
VPPTDIEKEARVRAILRIAALARQWRLTADSQAKRGYLLSGKALTEASLYADQDPDIRDLVAASEKHAQLWRRLLWGGLMVAAIGVVWFYFHEKEAAANLKSEIQRQIDANE